MHYTNGTNLLNTKQYDDAIVEFAKCENFDDSKQKINECHYLHAMEIKDTSPDESIKEFLASNLYNDSRTYLYDFAKSYVENQKYKEAHDIFSEIGKTDDPYCAYSDGMIALSSNDYGLAESNFKKSQEILDGKKQYEDALYLNAKKLMNASSFEDAKLKFDLISEYKDSANLKISCILGHAYNLYKKGHLNDSFKELNNIPDGTTYGDMSKEDLTLKIDKLGSWKDICGKWGTTGGEMRVTQQGSYGYSHWWYREFTSRERTIEVSCIPNDDGTVTVKTSGQLPVYTTYSPIALGVESGTVSLSAEQKLSSPGTISINDKTSLTLSKNGITASYNRKDNSKDVYFTYIYKTTMNFGERIMTY